MSGKVKQKVQINSTDILTMSVNEQILKDCHLLYQQSEKGLISLGDTVGLNLLSPRKKITVMLLGNHSAGKSSFINWYIEEHVQKTGVAIETQGFTFITSGRKRDSLTGNATLHLFPHFKQLQEIDGVVDYLSTEISTSKEKKFSLITFIDTPGLVDGDMKYPFDVNQTILSIGSLCDLILVFFDPIGQALCNRTLTLVEKLNENHGDKIKFFLSKADEAGHESDRQRVMMQIVQELCKRPGLNKAGFDMPTIYIPNSNKQTRCVNQISEACNDIEKTINHTIQNSLNNLEKDSDTVLGLIEKALTVDDAARKFNRKVRIKAMFLSMFGFLLPIFLMTQLLVASAPERSLIAIVGVDTAHAIVHYMTPFTSFWVTLSDETQLTWLAVTLVISAVLLILSRIVGQTRPHLQNRSKKVLIGNRVHIEDIKEQKHKFYGDYLKQSVNEQDI